MKKTLFAVILIIAELFTFTVIPASSAAEPTSVIVTVTPPEGADKYEYALACAKELTKRLPNSEYGYIYDTLMCGFSLELSESALIALSTYGFVTGVHADTEYASLSYEDKKNLAAEMAGVISGATDGLTGDGVKVAVIDSGFDVTHPAFDTEVTETLDLYEYRMQVGIPVRLTALRYTIDVNDFYYSSKIPFMFDYADRDSDVYKENGDHGTHVAGIIGAAPTESSSMQGIAPGCQLLLMKVFGDESTMASDSAIISALEDAVKLKADVINLSIGHYAGSTDLSSIGLDSVIEKAREAGCIVVCAAGNEGVSTDRAATDLPLTAYTDYGTLSAPASSNYTVAVGSVENSVIYGEHFRHTDDENRPFYFTDTNLTYENTEGSFTEYFNGKTLSYVTVPGIGEESDYEGLDVRGKIALVQRGIITFPEKTKIAAEHGAIGVIVYNNEPNAYVNMDLTDAALPAIFITLEDGALLAAKENKTLSFSTEYICVPDENGGKIAESSSRGTTPSLTLKPDVCAVGGDVYSTVNDGGYGGFSGTSMAAPQFSGMCALIIEKARRDGTDTDVTVALMNSATPVLQGNGVEYSPRAQGAGLVNFTKALNREVEITCATNSKPKAELFDKLSGTVSFDITVRNLTDKSLEASLGATLTTDGYKKIKDGKSVTFYNTLEAVADAESVITIEESENVNRYGEGAEALTLTLEPLEARTLTVTVSLDGVYHKNLASVFTNGYFIEGYVYCETENAEASLPYMGYVGDFSAAPVLDGDAYKNEPYMFDSTKFGVMFDNTMLPSGVNVFEGEYNFNKEYPIALSPNGDGRADTLYFTACQLRNTRKTVMNILDGDGEVVYSKELDYTAKTRGIDAPAILSLYWDGGDGLNSKYRLPDGDYTFEVSYTLDFGENTVQTYSYDFRVDTKLPTVKQIKYENGKLTVRAEDEGGILCLCVYRGGATDKTKYLETDGEATFDLSDFDGDVLYYDIVDAAYNVLVGKISLSALSGKE